MLNGRPAFSRHLPLFVLVAAVPLACAVGVDPEIYDDSATTPEPGTAGTLTSTGGSNAGAPATPPKAGTSSTNAGTSNNPFGGSSGTGGKPSTTGGSAGSTAGGVGVGGASTGGAAGGSSGGAAGSGGSGGGCACTKTLTWTDNTVLNWVSGDCLSVSGKNYVYTGTKAQTYANAQCNPGKQEAWCTDMGNDYKFMACP
jgi:hypothetical protein